MCGDWRSTNDPCSCECSDSKKHQKLWGSVLYSISGWLHRGRGQGPGKPSREWQPEWAGLIEGVWLPPPPAPVGPIRARPEGFTEAPWAQQRLLVPKPCGRSWRVGSRGGGGRACWGGHCAWSACRRAGTGSAFHLCGCGCGVPVRLTEQTSSRSRARCTEMVSHLWDNKRKYLNSS